MALGGVGDLSMFVFQIVLCYQIILWVVVRRLAEIAESRKSWNSHKLLVCGAQNGNVIVLAERPQ